MASLWRIDHDGSYSRMIDKLDIGNGHGWSNVNSNFIFTDYGKGTIYRYGKIDHIVNVLVSRPTSCAFWDPEGDTLFVTSARVGLTVEQLAEAPFLEVCSPLSQALPANRVSASALRRRTGSTGSRSFTYV